MEAKLLAFLKNVSVVRVMIFESLGTYFPLVYLEYAATFYTASLASSIIVMIAVFLKVRTITLISLHPVLMTIGTLVFVGNGLVLFRTRFLVEMLSPIMMKVKRTKGRSIHISLHIMGTVFLGLGILFVLTSKIEFDESLLPRSIHSIVGCFALLIMIAQIISGNQKISDIESKASNSKSQRYHADVGLFLWDLFCLSMVLGAAEYFGFSYSLAIVTVFIAVSWLSAHLQMRKKGPEGSTLGIFTPGAGLVYPAAVGGFVTGGLNGVGSSATEDFEDLGPIIIGAAIADEDNTDFRDEEQHIM